jgi:hypothetical protein
LLFSLTAGLFLGLALGLLFCLRYRLSVVVGCFRLIALDGFFDRNGLNGFFSAGRGLVGDAAKLKANGE